MKAMNISIDFMQREPQLNIIYSVSDVMTMGVVEGVGVSGRKGQVEILSVDGLSEGRNAIERGKIKAIVAQLPYLMGRRALDLAIETSTGKLQHYSEFIPTPLLTKEVLEKRNDPSLQYIR